MSTPHPQTVVLGAGVTGLSCALDLQSADHHIPITIIAHDLPTTSPPPPSLLDGPEPYINFASPWAGAHNRWVPPTASGAAHEACDHRLALATFRRMKDLAGPGGVRPEAGITFLRGMEYLEAPGPEYEALVHGGDEEQQHPGSAAALGIEGFRVLRPEELPGDGRVRLGFEYDTWCVSPMVYCSFLLGRFVARGGRVVRREVRGLEEVFGMGGELGGPVGVVVNASGMGFGDPRSFIIRGQTCLVANPCDATVTRQHADGSWSFCVPRGFGGGTVIGGTKEPDNWDPKPSPEVRERLCRSLLATYPEIADGDGSVRVLQDVVGWRPARHGGARLEREEVGPGRTVVHAYGFGGRGYELSWGVAETVVRLVAEGAGSAKARM